MKIKRKRKAVEHPGVGDLIATAGAEQIGIVMMRLHIPKTISVALSLLPREDINAKSERRNVNQARTMQLVFDSCWTEPVNKYFSRRLYRFDLFTYDETPKHDGSVVIRVFSRNTHYSYGAAHRRIDSIEISGRNVYTAPGI